MAAAAGVTGFLPDIVGSYAGFVLTCCRRVWDRMTSGLRTWPLLVGILYIGLAASQNYDDEKVNNAVR